jgi:predicted nucleotidyltransferase
MENPAGSAATRALETLGQNRDALLKRLTAGLQADRRVEAAWLTGSFGKGESDEWSDLDLNVVVTDESFDSLAEHPQELFDLGGKQLPLTAKNSPPFPSFTLPGGRFWLLFYEPAIEVDWSIGPLSQALRQPTSLLLFDKAGIPVSPEPAPVSIEERLATATKSFYFFWAMAFIAVKYAGRGHTRRVITQTGLLEDSFISMWRALYRPEHLQAESHDQNRMIEPELDARLPRFGPVITPVTALEVVRAFCHEMERLQDDFGLVGLNVPAGIPSHLYYLADLAEIVARDGGSRPYKGSRR